MTNKTTWCPLPWMSLNIRNDGAIRVCCNSNTSAANGLIKNTDGVTYNLSKDGIHDFRNADKMKEIRRAMLAGEYHPACIRCQREDEAGMESRRVWESEIWKNDITEQTARQATEPDGTIDVHENPLLYADLRFGNLCNLKCRMCGPTDSNQWYDDYVSVWETDTYNGVKLISDGKGRYSPETDIYNWYENPNFWLELEDEIPNLRRLYIVGGEPLLIDQHYEFLQKCVDSGHSKRMLVEYNTNLTNIPRRAWDIWKHFGTIQIGASIDGVGVVNDYIRYPSKWKSIESNLRKLDDAEGNFKVWWAATVQAYNMVHLPEMMLWKIRQNFKRINSPLILLDRPIITPHPLHKPDFLNVKIYPNGSKKRISDMFESSKSIARDEIYSMRFHEDESVNLDAQRRVYSQFSGVLDSYVKYMNAEDYSGQLGKFWKYTDRLDQIRNESFRDIDPEAYELLRMPAN